MPANRRDPFAACTVHAPGDRLLLSLLALCVFFVGATEFMVAPLLSPIGTAFNATPAEAALLISGYALAYAIGAPLLGLLFRSSGRRPLLLSSLFLLALDGVAVTLAPSLPLAIGLRILGGLAAAGLIPAVFALIADHYSPARQSAAMGHAMLGMTAGIVSGPAIAGVLAQELGWQAPFLASALGCLLLLPAAWSILPHGTSRRPHATDKPASTAKRQCAGLLIAKALWNGTAVAGFALTGEYLRRRYGLATAEAGFAVAFFGIGLAAGNLTTGRARGFMGSDERLLLSAVFLLGAAFAAFLILPLPLFGALAALFASGLALGYAAPASTTLLAARAGPSKGVVLALSESANNLALLFLLSLSASVFEQQGMMAAGILLLCGMGCGIALLVSDLGQGTQPKERE
ncbi:mfs transporter [Nitratireductor indicus C115]|uniref:Mfs transporter n=1 Tax=Nitratireductor indicus C115 TaxID=1231190 RepID=K2PHT1_9HYPH|nr:MFS transporter [Nitratireductor indicus]EKF40687.1 mfs transporter [Nitratireductor indicus C115]SFQ42917.1 Predicted arabinose efflux permease, MFS family [Nitratireductor indicus]